MDNPNQDLMIGGSSIENRPMRRASSLGGNAFVGALRGRTQAEVWAIVTRRVSEHCITYSCDIRCGSAREARTVRRG